MNASCEMKGKIHSFLSMGTVDGPGVRSVVFMQGCPLRCAFCHNPDTWDLTGGSEVSVEELMKKILRCRAYFGREGGVTVSGGEALLQSEFVSELFRACRFHGINTALDTSGCITDGKAMRVLDFTDLCLLDIKFDDEHAYKQYTGGSFEKTVGFLELLEAMNIPTWIRRVIVPVVNDASASAAALGALLKKYICVKKVEFLPFRKLCNEKYTMLREEFPERHKEYVFRFGEYPECSAAAAQRLCEEEERVRLGI